MQAQTANDARMGTIPEWISSHHPFIHFLHEYDYVTVNKHTFTPDRTPSPEYLKLQRFWSEFPQEGDEHVSLKIHLVEWYSEQYGTGLKKTHLPEFNTSFFDCFEVHSPYGRADVQLDDNTYGEAGNFDWYRLIRSLGFYFKETYYNNLDSPLHSSDTIVHSYKRFEDKPELYTDLIRDPVDSLYHLPYEAQSSTTRTAFEISPTGEWPPSESHFREYQTDHAVSFEYEKLSVDTPQLTI